MDRKYVISFGDSTKYRISYDGTLKDFENSDKLRIIKDKVNDFLKSEFPDGGYHHLTELTVAEDDGRDYTDFDKEGFSHLLDSLKTQVEVMKDTFELNNNAPYDKE